MTKQLLSIEQMQHLQEMGLDTTNASMYWISYNGISVSIPSNFHLPTSDNDYVICDAYTLQDVLDALPKRIYDKGAFYLGCYDIMIDEYDICYAKWCGAEIESTCVEMEIKDNLIDAAYSMLCWCIENGHVNTKN